MDNIKELATEELERFLHPRSSIEGIAFQPAKEELKRRVRAGDPVAIELLIKEAGL